MFAADRLCHDLAARQHGVFSRAQARRAGMSARAIAGRVSRGEWIQVHPGVYRPRAIPASWRSDLAAALIWAGREGLVTHQAAGRLWRLDGLEDGAVEISVRIGRDLPGVIVHRLRPGDRPTRRLVEGFPLTSPERTLLDIAGVLPAPRAGLALDDALRRRLTTLRRLRRILEVEGRCGRKGTATLRRLLTVRDGAEALLESALETRLFRLLKGAGLPRPTPQFEVRSGRRVVARLDFAYPELRLGIEAHGYRWHGGYERWRRDLRRDNALKRLGWVVLVFSWDDVVGEPRRVLEEVRAAIAGSHAGPPGLLPAMNARGPDAGEVPATRLVLSR